MTFKHLCYAFVAVMLLGSAVLVQDALAAVHFIVTMMATGLTHL